MKYSTLDEVYGSTINLLGLTMCSHKRDISHLFKKPTSKRKKVKVIHQLMEIMLKFQLNLGSGQDLSMQLGRLRKIVI